MWPIILSNDFWAWWILSWSYMFWNRFNISLTNILFGRIYLNLYLRKYSLRNFSKFLFISLKLLSNWGLIDSARVFESLKIKWIGGFHLKAFFVYNFVGLISCVKIRLVPEKRAFSLLFKLCPFPLEDVKQFEVEESKVDFCLPSLKVQFLLIARELLPLLHLVLSKKISSWKSFS